ncbi:MAG: hypothetical protein P4M08_09835 [Oligoflexia bacterium]|nr:hypothetical protein [Oligoflexia bacterium]
MSQVREYSARRFAAGYRILHIAFVLIPIVAGIDKFFHRLVDWEMYLSPAAQRVLGTHAHLFMQISGIGEICIGIGMFFLPRIFAYVVTAWLLSIVINLLLSGTYYDIALRDFVLALCALSLGRLSDAYKSDAAGPA